MLKWLRRFFGKFFKKENSFEGLFRAHIAISARCARAAMELFTEMDQIIARIAEITALEHEADSITSDVHHLSDRSFMTRIDKPDILSLIQELDNITDSLHHAADFVDIYGISERVNAAGEVLGTICEMIKIIQAQIEKMPNLSLVDSQKAYSEVDALETKADTLWKAAVKDAFQKLEAKEFIARKDVLDMLEKTANTCLSAMSVLNSIVRKGSQ